MYDAINAYGPGEQPDFSAGLAAERGATTIVDLGCGTGMLTRALAAQGYRMMGIDPAPTMLAVARRRPGSCSLAGAGFTVERVFGGWDRRPPGPATRELVVVASR